MARDTSEVEKLLKILERKTDKEIVSVRAEKPKKEKKKRKYIYGFKKLTNFIQDTNIKPGKYFHESNILFSYFNKWDKAKRTKIKVTSFISFMKLYFKFKINKKEQVFFGINKDLRDYLTPQRTAALNRRKNEKKE